MATPRRECALAVLGGRLYALGGHDGVSHLASVEVYDPAEDAWSRLADMPGPRSYHCATRLGTTENTFIEAVRPPCSLSVAAYRHPVIALCLFFI